MSQPNPPVQWLLGIDFGTSNTAAAHTRGGAVETLPLTHEGNLMPSAVFIESPQSIDVGAVALNRAETNPSAFIPSPKRVVGQGMAYVNGYDIPTWVPVMAILRSVLERATAAHRGQPPAALVLTHPEGWAPREVQVLRDAAAQLGFHGERVHTVSEPRAAAHYYTRAAAPQAGEQIAVFDFGGGTLDIAVLAATERGSFEVVAARGDNGLGGKNLDALIRRWVDQQLADRDPDLLAFIRGSAPQRVLRNLEDSICRAKELLSATGSASITMSDSRTDRQVTLQLTLAELEAVIGPEIDRAIALTRATLAEAGAVTAIYLTGGSSRIPLVQRRVGELAPIATLDDPKTVVIQGALIAVLQGQAGPAPRAPIASGPVANAPVPVAPVQVIPAPVVPAPAPVGAAPAASGPRRPLLIAGAAMLVVAVVAGLGWLVLKPDGDPPQANSGGASATTPSDAGSAADLDALNAFTEKYVESVNQVPTEEIRALQCSTLQPSERAADDPSRFQLDEVIAANISKNTARSRLRVTNLTDSTSSILVFDFLREGGEWKFCGAADQ